MLFAGTTYFLLTSPLLIKGSLTLSACPGFNALRRMVYIRLFALYSIRLSIYNPFLRSDRIDWKEELEREDTQVSFKYSLLNDIVKKLKQRSLSAGNIYNKKQAQINGTSETLRNETVKIVENVKNVSLHIPKHVKPVNDDKFGHYLAGLIEGEGHFSTQLQLIIAFHSLDASLAYYIKERLGNGSVKKIKNKNAYLFILSSTEGLKKVINLINGKIRTENKFNQITDNILNHKSFAELKNKSNFTLNLDKDLNNHWLAGFSDANASFQIKILNRKNRLEVRLNFQIDQKKDNLLILIKNYFGGNISYSKSQDTYYYSSTSFGSAKKLINYFDHYHLLSSKHINYLK